MAENIHRQNPTRLKQPIVALDIGETEGEPIIGWDGVFNMLIPIYSSDMNTDQIREAAILDDEGNVVKEATAWQTYATFDSIFNDTVKNGSNYDYRFTTATAGSRVVLGVQWVRWSKWEQPSMAESLVAVVAVAVWVATDSQRNRSPR